MLYIQVYLTFKKKEKGKVFTELHTAEGHSAGNVFANSTAYEGSN